MPLGWPPTVTAPAGRGGNWPTEAPRLALSRLQTCTGRSSRTICGHPNTKLYPGIAATLATMAELYERGGRSADFASFIAQIRQDYGRRPSLMKALDAKGL